MKKIIALAVATAISAPAMADLTIGGSARYGLTKETGSAAASQGRVQMSIAGSGASESGVTVAGKAVLNSDMATNALGYDDIMMSIGTSAATVKLGRFEGTANFVGAPDLAEATTGVAGYEGKGAIRGRDVGNIQVDAAMGGATLFVQGRIGSNELRYGVSAGMGDVSVAALAETDAGYALNVKGSFSDVGVALSYANDDTANSSVLGLNASYAGVGVSIDQHSTATGDETRIYGGYTVTSLAGVEGASLELAAGTASRTGVSSVNKVGVRLNYAF